MSETIRISKGAIIDALAKSCFDDIEMNMEKLDDILYNGWRGLNNEPIQNLISDYQEYICPEDPCSVTVILTNEE